MKVLFGPFALYCQKLLGTHPKNTFFDQNHTSINDFNNIDQLFTEPDWHNDLYQVAYSLLPIKAKAGAEVPTLAYYR